MTRRPRIVLTAWKRPVRTMVGDPEQLFTLAEEYVQGVRAAGGIPIVAPPAAAPESAPEVLEVADGLILTGGGDLCPTTYGASDEGVSIDVDPDEDAWDLALVREAKERRLPFVGICRGLQALNVALGGTLLQEISGRPHHPPIPNVPAEAVAFRHPVRITPESVLARIYATCDRRVNSLHHQAVDRLGEGLIETARSPDGLVEGLEYVNGATPDAAWHAVGVQWHPERMQPKGLDQRLFDDLVRRARTHSGADSSDDR